uniref:Ig-like domain-containing protein n=1 Tax=Zosterops lateralis melanops TaxID=1220523 RepID=A0A8D2PT47_ZOSLA
RALLPRFWLWPPSQQDGIWEGRVSQNATAPETLQLLGHMTSRSGEGSRPKIPLRASAIWHKEPLCMSEKLPVATVFTRSPRLDQLLLVCHVTGFYPRPISVAWLRDGQEVPPGPVLNSSPILPKADLTHQLCSVLAVAPRDGHSYVCRVRHQSLGTRRIALDFTHAASTIGIIVAVLLLLATASAGVFWWWKHR